MLRVEQVSKSFGDRAVLNNLSLQVESGEIYGLLGPNGAGKTTTINLICGLLAADSGNLCLNGQPISHSTKAQIGLAPQDNLLYRSLTCAENLDFFCPHLRVIAQRSPTTAFPVAWAAVNLGERAHSIVSTLSGGMQRRLNIAIALIHHPKLAILDEPTTGLDIEARYEIWQLIRELKQQGIAVFLTTHSLEEAERLCQRIGILKDGSIIAEGSLTDLKKFVDADEIVTIHTPHPQQAIARAQQLGWNHRFYGEELALWLPEPVELGTLIDSFAGISLDSVARQPVRLEHVYWEVAQLATPSVS